MDKAKAMLDALMGPSRNASASDKSTDWKDKSVCEMFLVGFCPYDKAVLGGRRGMDPCPKIHNEMLREAFNQHEDGAASSSFRHECEDKLLRALVDAVAEKELYAKKQLESKRADGKLRIMPGGISTTIRKMKREAMALKEKADAMDDSEGIKKEQLQKEATQALADYDAFVTEEERKVAQAAGPRAMSCEVCGTAYAGDDEYKLHLNYKLHGCYSQVLEKLEELKAKKEERDKMKKGSDKEGDMKKKKDSGGRRSRDRAKSNSRRKDDASKSRRRGKDKGKRRGEKEKDSSRSRERRKDKHNKYSSASRRRSRCRGTGSSKRKRDDSRSRSGSNGASKNDKKLSGQRKPSRTRSRSFSRRRPNSCDRSCSHSRCGRRSRSRRDRK